MRHDSHVTRSSDSSAYDEVCVNCGATDIAGGGWGKLGELCPKAEAAHKLIVLVDSDEGHTLWVVSTADFNSWANGDTFDDAPDICAFVWHDDSACQQVESLAKALEIAGDSGLDIETGLQY